MTCLAAWWRIYHSGQPSVSIYDLLALETRGHRTPTDDLHQPAWQTSKKQKSSLPNLSHRGKEYVVSAEIARPMTATGLADVRLISGASKGPQFPYKWIIPSFIFLIHHLPDSPAICDRRTKFLSSLDSPLPSATLRYLLCGIDSLSSALQRWQTPDLAINGTLVTVLYIQIAVARQSLRLLPSVQFPRDFKRRLPYGKRPTCPMNHVHRTHLCVSGRHRMGPKISHLCTLIYKGLAFNASYWIGMGRAR